MNCFIQCENSVNNPEMGLKYDNLSGIIPDRLSYQGTLMAYAASIPTGGKTCGAVYFDLLNSSNQNLREYHV